MTYAEVCAGIMGFGLGLDAAGMECLWRCEIDKNCQKLIRSKSSAPLYPDLLNLATDLPVGLPHLDVLCGGTPCQAFSISGKRQGLNDDRGNLTLAFARLADRLDPTIVLWENVPGVLSDSTNAFGCLLGSLVGADRPCDPIGRDGKWPNAGVVAGSKRIAGWRILDAQYFGVAQRRRRVFLVGYSLEARRPVGISDVQNRERVLGLVTAILFEPESVRRHTPPRREKGTRLAPTVGVGPPYGRTGNDRVEADAMVFTMMPMNSSKDFVARKTEIAQPLMSAGVQLGNQGGDVVVSPTAFAIQHASIGRKDEAGPQGKGYQEEVAFTLDTRGDADAVVDVSHCLMGKPNDSQDPTMQTYVTQELYAFGHTNAASAGMRVDSDATDALQTPPNIPAIAFCERSREGGRSLEVQEELANCLNDNGSGGNNKSSRIMTGMQVRRLTPVECERLQAFDDGHTQDFADSTRYKMLGNAVNVAVSKWLGQRIVAAMRESA